MAEIILASQSPRRQMLLEKMGVPFTAIPSNFDEQLDDARSPEEVAIELALGKATAVAQQHPSALVIGSDTIVTFQGRQLEKPVDAAEARQTLRMLAGGVNTVTTSLVVVCMEKNIRLVGSDATDVYFKPRDDTAIDTYVATGDPLDKAGSYGIQSGAAVLIDHIKGNYDVVIGLPTKLLQKFLHKCGVTTQAVRLDCPVPRLEKMD